jgi:hypothetical protein
MQQLFKQGRVRLTTAELNNLTKEVNETIFQQDIPGSKVRFTNPELWRIQRSKRSVVIRKYI